MIRFICVMLISVTAMIGTSLAQNAATENAAKENPDAKAILSANQLRLSYIETGDTQIDKITRQGLNALTKQLNNRTAFEPVDPVAVDLAVDDLTPHVFLYWVVTADTPIPNLTARRKINQFMQTGGLLIIDTRDGERRLSDQRTAEQDRLQDILRVLNIPLLAPIAADHVVMKSYYLLPTLQGRNDAGRVWAESPQNTVNDNDNVTAVIIGGRDWAASWARGSSGQYTRPMGSATQDLVSASGYQIRSMERREYAIRTGINMVMMSLTGNYKKDQVHMNALLDKLGYDRLNWSEEARP